MKRLVRGVAWATVWCLALGLAGAAEPVARFDGREISVEEISPTEKELARQKRTDAKPAMDKWLLEYHGSRLQQTIATSLLAEFAKANDCAASDAEIDEFNKTMDEQMAESDREWKEDLREVSLALEARELSKDKRQKLQERQKTLTQILTSRAEEKAMDAKATPAEREEFRAGARDIGRQAVEAWKLNRALFRKYGGRVIWQQAGIEPVDAYRWFLETKEKEDRFAIPDPALRAEFYRYFTTTPHTYLKPGDFDFEKPWWKQKATKE